MKKSFLAAALLTASVWVTSASASIAESSSTFTPYVCTPAGDADATATIVTNSGGGDSFYLQTVTAANGNSSAGGVYVPSNQKTVFSTLVFNVKGTVSAATGPWVFVYGTNASGQPTSLVVPYSSSNIVGKSTKGTAMNIRMPKRSTTKITISDIIIGFYPGKASATNVVSNIEVNGDRVVADMTTYDGCPAGTGAP